MSLNSEYVRLEFRDQQTTSDESFQRKKELYYIYLQEAKLRRQLEFPIDDDVPNPLRTYQRLEQGLAERRKFFLFTGHPKLARCYSLPSICYPRVTASKQHSPTASNDETIPKKQTLFRTRSSTSTQPRVSGPGLAQKYSSWAADNKARQGKACSVGRGTQLESQQQWKITIHRRTPMII